MTMTATGARAAEAAAVTPIKVKKIGHLVYEVSDIERSVKFWTEIMGFSVSDRNEWGMVFLRTATDHHTIALVPGKSPRRPAPEAGLQFNHLAMEVGSVEELFKIRAFLKEKGIPIQYEGRKGPGGNMGIEFLDPDGYLFELYADMDQIGTDGKSRPSDQWIRVTSLEEALEKPLRKSW